MCYGGPGKKFNLVYSERTLKSTTLGIINQLQQKLFGIFLSSINPDVHVNKQKHFTKGVWGHEPHPPEANIFLKKINKMEVFPLRYEMFYIFFYFFAVLTKSPKL